MDFSIKAKEVITTVLSDEISRNIGTGEIRDLVSLENGIRAALKEVGCQVYEKVLEKECVKR